tara:strand:+ start:252 stop:398 length:147 start_codon:yes stop_codon:yes gene_type:complete
MDKIEEVVAVPAMPAPWAPLTADGKSLYDTFFGNDEEPTRKRRRPDKE